MVFYEAVDGAPLTVSRPSVSRNIVSIQFIFSYSLMLTSASNETVVFTTSSYLVYNYK